MRSLSKRSKAAGLIAALVTAAAVALVAATGGLTSPYMNLVFWGVLAAIAVIWMAHFLLTPPRQPTKEELYNRAKYGPGTTNFHMDGWSND
jgi:hypothetical protein